MEEIKNFIQLKEDNIIRIGIKDKNGNDTGEHLEFDVEDIELPFRISDCEKQHVEDVRELKAKFMIIEKKQDEKRNGLMSKNEEEKLKAINEFYKKEEKAMDLFLGVGATKKLLNGRKPYYTMYEDISEMLEPIIPIITKNTKSIEDRIRAKYNTKKKEEEIL